MSDSLWSGWNFYLHNTSGRTITLDRINLQPNWVPEIFLGGKGGWCVYLTTLPISHADCPYNWDFQTPGTLWVCNRTVIGMLYLTFSTAALSLQTNGSQIWPFGAGEGHANFIRGQNNVCVGHRKFTVGMKYFKFKTKLKFPLSPTRPALQKISFNLLLFPHFLYLSLDQSGWHICGPKLATDFLF
jgi:hypothetical protein